MSLFRWGALTLAAAALTATSAGCGGGDDAGSAAQAPVATTTAGGQGAAGTTPAPGTASATPGSGSTPGAGDGGAGGSDGTGGSGGSGGDGSGKGAKTVPAADRCHPQGLKLEVTGYNSGAGQRFASLVFTNSTKKPCRMSGWPTLRLGTASEGFDTTVVKQGSASVVTVAAGGKAHTELRWSAVAASDESGSQCQPTPVFLQVFAPDEKEPGVAQWKGGPVCQHNRLETSAVKSGAGA